MRLRSIGYNPLTKSCVVGDLVQPTGRAGLFSSCMVFCQPAGFLVNHALKRRRFELANFKH